MVDREQQLKVEQENDALKKLQAAAGIIDKEKTHERLDWMYEQSATQKQDEDELMNKPVKGQVDQDMADIKALTESTAGSLFLRSATKTTEDTLRKLREDPLFQIKQQERAARLNMMANPLVAARIKAKEDKRAKKEQKLAKKAAKKEKKKAKKAKKKEKKAAKKAGKKGSSSSSSSSSDDSDAAKGPPPDAARRGSRDGQEERPALGMGQDRRHDKDRRASPGRDRDRDRDRRSRSPPPQKRKRDEAAPGYTHEELRKLGPQGAMISKREERAQQVSQQKEAAIASRGLMYRLSEEEKKARVDQMYADARTHEKTKNERIANAERKEKEIEELEAKMRTNQSTSQKIFKDMREKVYMEGGSLESRLNNQKHKRQRGIVDDLEKD
eukprot:gnl/TRDRNA2_/TRDRNA2_131492_c0_seq1.p1 gnl/TRDRNA2_/TRDRNA2_131492_c0~~gnl/TRDRNA2_/TRDRNA2_131492_c0_seq1.p1  ORF type:complete len:416 (-),score=142.79 gnl/TRDRNA2_/TRDRNA2_131492_c0_seq1:110-1264(-)